MSPSARWARASSNCAAALPGSLVRASRATLAAAVRERAFVERCRSELLADGQRLKELLGGMELTFSPSVTPFTLVRVARAEQVSAELLSQHQIAVYDATRVGLPDHLRIAAPDYASLARLKTALEQVLERRGYVRGREV